MKHTQIPGTCYLCSNKIYEKFGECVCNECKTQLPPKYRVAPELLDALKITLDIIADHENMSGLCIQTRSIDMIKALITKASAA